MIAVTLFLLVVGLILFIVGFVTYQNDKPKNPLVALTIAGAVIFIVGCITAFTSLGYIVRYKTRFGSGAQIKAQIDSLSDKKITHSNLPAKQTKVKSTKAEIARLKEEIAKSK